MPRQRFHLKSLAAWLWPFYALLMAAGIYLLTTNAAPVTLSWETASEVGTAGFNVYRAEVSSTSDAEPAWVRVNPTTIPARGSELAGATYCFEDDDVVPGHSYRYQIEEVEWSGERVTYPQVIEVRAGLPRLVTRAMGTWLLVLGGALLARHIGQRTSGHSYDEDRHTQS